MEKPWHSLEAIWEGDEKIIVKGLPDNQVSPGWMLLLLGDGSPTRHLQIATNSDIEIELIDMTPVGLNSDNAPDLLNQVAGPRIRRQVWIKSSSGKRLAYAVSWWAENKVDRYLKDRSVSIWKSLTSSRIELYRDIRRIQYGNSELLEVGFGADGPFWGRYYLFWHQGQPLTLIYEVFSSTLEEFLGESRWSTVG